MTVIESNVMVSPLNDPNNFKHIEADSQLNRGRSIISEKAVVDEASSVSLSRASRQMAALKELIIHAPEVCKERVDFLRNELHSGSYRILDDRIATRMLADLAM